MICLDTNYLVRGLLRGVRESDELVQWRQHGEILLTAAPAWYEFLCGPVSDLQIRVIRHFFLVGLPRLKKSKQPKPLASLMPLVEFDV
ncbi:MAG TPA: hypothetical protein VF020_14330 [Chthoniobacterales bacterium]